MALKAGEMAPSFEGRTTDGSWVKLSDFRGKKLVLYFYPKDDTPGCTKEACGFRDDSKALTKLGAVVLGVSPDKPESHKKFIAKFKLPFPLLCDPDHKVMEKYGAWGEKILYGQKKVGVIRSTTIVGPDGKVLRHWKNVPKAETHPAQVLEFLRAQK